VFSERFLGFSKVGANNRVYLKPLEAPEQRFADFQFRRHYKSAHMSGDN